MDKSFLSILKEEEFLLDKIDHIEKETIFVQRQRDLVSKYPFDCQAKVNDLLAYDKEISVLIENAENCRIQLSDCRKDIKRYIQMLFDK